MTEIIYRRASDPVVNEPLPDQRTLFLMAKDILVLLQSCSHSQGVLLPARRFVYPSPVPADCEQAVVTFSGWDPMPPWDGLQHCEMSRWVGNFGISITRCTPAISGKRTPPTIAQMEEAALIASTDAEIMLCLAAAFGEIGPEITVLTQAPQGGLQTTELTIQIPAFGGLE